MLRIWVDKVEGKIKILTDIVVEGFLKVTKTESKFIPWKREWGTMTETTKIYDKKKKQSNGEIEYTLGLGWAAYIAGVFKPYISTNDYSNLLTAIMADTYRTAPFKELRDYQNDDVLHLLKYRIGLFSCYTSYQFR